MKLGIEPATAQLELGLGLSLAMTNSFKCNICDEQIVGRSEFMMHKKNNHADTIPTCSKFLEGKCNRNQGECWFIHKNSLSQDFQRAPANPYPPDHIKQIMRTLSQMSIQMENVVKKLTQTEI